VAEKVVVIGAGMAGLWTAMALAPTGRQVIVLDRDPPPPEGGPEEAFVDWGRRGVGHLRHSHAFLARLRKLIRDEHPALLEALLAEGCRELPFEQGLTEAHKRNFKPEPIDRDLVILTSRRTTLELVMRRYAAGLPGVSLRSDQFAKDLEIAPGPTPRVTGVRLEDGEVLTADVVVDAAGRMSSCFEQLTGAGAHITETGEPAGVVYFTRHYQLLAGNAEPPRSKNRATGDMGYLKFGVFPGDNGSFSITLCAPEVEEEMRKAVVDPEVFDRVCREIPGLEPWVAADRARPISRVFGMGQLESRWRDLAPEGKPAVLGFFSLGDSLVRTNPLYGRGCSFAAVGASLLREALRATPDPAQRLLHYRAGVERELRPYYEVMRKADQGAIRRARHALTPGYKPDLRAKLAKSFLEDGVGLAIREDIDLMRAFLRGFHMLEHPDAWLKRPANLAKVMRYWARRKDDTDKPPPLGPKRDALFATLGLSPTADIERLAQA
jgi:2-polyprenyl-6-methoxyphenol hydroxylase-like FAD-dependent oxidoreductase